MESSENLSHGKVVDINLTSYDERLWIQVRFSNPESIAPKNRRKLKIHYTLSSDDIFLKFNVNKLKHFIFFDGEKGRAKRERRHFQVRSWDRSASASS